jgi:hypothetical protein
MQVKTTDGNMRAISSDFGQVQTNQELMSEIEEVKTRAMYMLGFGILLAFSTMALVLKNRG